MLKMFSLLTLPSPSRLHSAAITSLLALWMLNAGCTVETQIKHDPVLATSTDTITFTAESQKKGSGSIVSQEIRIYVDGVHVQTCAASPCSYTGGPYTALEDEWLVYHTEVEADFELSVLGITLANSDSDIDLGATGISRPNHTWKAADGVTHIPARWGAHTSGNTNVLFQRSDDYNSVSDQDGLEDFLDDLSFKIHDLLMPKETIWGNMNDLNLYAYRRSGNTDSGCPGVLNSFTIAETSAVIDDHGMMHVTNFQDCTTSFSIFSFEGATITQAFLHEFHHSVQEQADEYSGPTYYFQAANEPNIFETEANCQSEQINKGRDPAACYEFTTGWWGIHTGTTVMTNGMFAHPFSIESIERQEWWFKTW